jgi:membrane protein DedA with SNARE-associated domain
MLNGNTTMGKGVLTSHGLNFEGYFYWISLGALFGFTILFDLGFILALTYLKRKSLSNTFNKNKKIEGRSL